MNRAKELLGALGIVTCCLAPAAVADTVSVGVSPGERGRIAALSDTCPTFSWTAVKGVRSWDLVVYEVGREAIDQGLDGAMTSDPALRVRLPGGALSWTPDNQRALEPGSRYGWLVRPVLASGAGRWSSPRLFEITAVPEVKEVEEALEVLRRYLKREGIEEEELTGLAAFEGESVSIVRSKAVAVQKGPEPNNLILEFSEVAILADVSSADPAAAPAYAVAGTVALGGDGSAGVYGEVAAQEGRVHGVAGVTQSATDESAGVIGEAVAQSGETRGVSGVTRSATDYSAGVSGEAAAQSGETRGVSGVTRSATDYSAGVSGEAQAASGAVRGVRGRTVSTSDGAAGVFGKSEGGSGNTAGVEGLNSSSTDRAAGVRGRSDSTSGKTYGVAGSTDSGAEGAAGVAGTATTGQAVGLRGETSSADARSAGIEAVSTSPLSPALRVRGPSGGRALALDGSADGLSDVFVGHAGIDLNSPSDRRFSLSNSGGGGVELRVGTDRVLVEGDVSGGLTLPYEGVSAADGQIFRVESTGTGGAGAFINSPADPTASQSALFVWNEGESSGIYVNQVGNYKAIDIYSTSTSQPGVQINHDIPDVDALYVDGETRITSKLSVGSVTGLSPSGLFNNGLTVFGRTYVWGELDATSVSAAVKAFRIDHPLKPETHYLSHSSIESWERLNLYTGLAQLDEAGNARIDLPAWFEPLNTDFCYQLTAIDESMPGLFISKSIEGNRFAIGGGLPGGRVSWQVTGVRKDPYALAHPLEVESEKSPEDVGLYMYPEVYGLPIGRAIMAPD